MMAASTINKKWSDGYVICTYLHNILRCVSCTIRIQECNPNPGKAQEARCSTALINVQLAAALKHALLHIQPRFCGAVDRAPRWPVRNQDNHDPQHTGARKAKQCANWPAVLLGAGAGARHASRHAAHHGNKLPCLTWTVVRAGGWPPAGRNFSMYGCEEVSWGYCTQSNVKQCLQILLVKTAGSSPFQGAPQLRQKGVPAGAAGRQERTAFVRASRGPVLVCEQPPHQGMHGEHRQER